MADLIDRQAAIDNLRGKDPSQVWDTADIEVWVNALPSAQPEKKEGKWMLQRTFDDGQGNVTFQVFCSKCGVAAYEFLQPYCHKCGARMIYTQE